MSQLKWDERFLGLARHIAAWSKDPSTKTGAVIVRPDRTIVSLGYNGFPMGMKDDSELYDNREVKYSRVVHCEINAILFAKESLNGCTLYTWPFISCDRCAVQVIQAKIVRCVAPWPTTDQAARWGDSFIRSREFFYEAGVTVHEIQ